MECRTHDPMPRPPALEMARIQKPQSHRGDAAIKDLPERQGDSRKPMGEGQSRTSRGLAMNHYGCNTQAQGPRGRTTSSLMQSGWREIRRGEIVTREPVMVPVTTEWLPMKCGRLEQIGVGPDKLCTGCENEVKA